jgi:hypothetical protein
LDIQVVWSWIERLEWILGKGGYKGGARHVVSREISGNHNTAIDRKRIYNPDDTSREAFLLPKCLFRLLSSSGISSPLCWLVASDKLAPGRFFLAIADVMAGDCLYSSAASSLD